MRREHRPDRCCCRRCQCARFAVVVAAAAEGCDGCADVADADAAIDVALRSGYVGCDAFETAYGVVAGFETDAAVAAAAASDADGRDGVCDDGDNRAGSSVAVNDSCADADAWNCSNALRRLRRVRRRRLRHRRWFATWPSTGMIRSG